MKIILSKNLLLFKFLLFQLVWFSACGFRPNTTNNKFFGEKIQNVQALTATAEKTVNFENILFETPLGNDLSSSIDIVYDDFDNDGEPEFFVINSVGPNQLWKTSANGKFEEIAGQVGLNNSRNSRGVAVADFDGDGDLDIFLAIGNPNTLGSQSNLYYENSGQLTKNAFRDVSLQKFSDTNSFSNSAIAFDFDGDEYLDIYVSNNGKNELYHNRIINDNFVRVTKKANVGGRSDMVSNSALAFDYDQDGDQDLLVLNHGPNVLYQNNGDQSFTDVTNHAGISGIDIDGNYPISYSAINFDFDNDGDDDVFISTSIANQLYQNNGNGTFTRFSGNFPPSEGGYAVALDFNEDGFTDLFVGNPEGPNKLLINLDGHFEDGSSNFNISKDTNPTTKVLALDYEFDGDMDIFVLNFGKQNLLYRNSLY